MSFSVASMVIPLVAITGCGAATSATANCESAAREPETSGPDMEALEELAELYLDGLELLDEGGEGEVDADYSRTDALSRLMVAAIPVLAAAGASAVAIDVGRSNRAVGALEFAFELESAAAREEAVELARNAVEASLGSLQSAFEQTVAMYISAGIEEGETRCLAARVGAFRAWSEVIATLSDRLEELEADEEALDLMGEMTDDELVEEDRLADEEVTAHLTSLQNELELLRRRLELAEDATEQLRRAVIPLRQRRDDGESASEDVNRMWHRANRSLEQARRACAER